MINPIQQSDRILRIRDVIERTGLSKATIYRLGNAGIFPKRVKLGISCVGWRESDINAWTQSREYAG